MRVAVLAGDGIGPEVTAAAQAVLAEALPGIVFEAAPAGGAALDACGDPMPPATLALCERADAVLFGAVGGPQYDAVPRERRPETGLLRLRRHFELYANVRPSQIVAGLEARSPLRPDLARNVDLVIVRELTGGLYFGDKTIAPEGGERVARETLVYRESEIRRVVRFAFTLAAARRGRLASVDKANVLASSQLWREIVTDVAPEFRGVDVEHVLVDTAAMRLVAAPASFDVVVTENLFGDILSDEAAALTGSIGTAPSASLGGGSGGRRFGVYEPIAGSAPDIAGRGIANPTGAILSAALLARWSLDAPAAAAAIEAAVADALRDGPRTPDLASPGEAVADTAAFTAQVVEGVRRRRAGWTSGISRATTTPEPIPR